MKLRKPVSPALLLTILLALIFCLLITVFLIRRVSSGDTGLNGNEESHSFSAYLDTLFQETISHDALSLNFLLEDSASYGITAAEASLGVYTEDSLNTHRESLRETLAKLESFDNRLLTEEELLIKEALLWYYSRALSESEYSELSNPISPVGGLQTQLPLLFSEYRLDEKSDLETYFLLLDSVYDCFESIAATMTERFANGTVPAGAAAAAAGQYAEFLNVPLEENLLITSFSERLSQMEYLTEVEYATYEMKNRYRVKTSVLPAYVLVLETLTEAASYGTGTEELGLCSLPDGAAYYAEILKRTTSSDLNVAQAKALLQRYLSQSLVTMQNLSRENPELMETAYSALRSDGTSLFPGNTAEETLAFLQTACADLLPLTDAISAPEVTLKELPDCLQNLCGPALYLLSPIDNISEHTVYYNPLYEGSDSFSTLAHETFPGHLCAHAVFLNGNPHPVRSLIDFIGWDEGWASFAENYALSFCVSASTAPNAAGADRTTVEFLSASSLSLLCLYGLTDIGIHADGWTQEETAAFWSTYGIPEESAIELWSMLLYEPGYYLPYSVGCLEMYELQNKVRQALGTSYSDSVFFTELLELGPLPFSLCETELSNRLGITSE